MSENRHQRICTLDTKTRGGFDGHYCLIVPDHSAGHPRRYTVYRIPARSSGRIRIIGRELPLGFARRLAKETL